MKRISDHKIFVFNLIGFLLTATISCTTEVAQPKLLPTLTTYYANTITPTSADIECRIISDLPVNFNVCGVYWDTISNPTTSNNVTVCNSWSTFSFTAKLNGLKTGTIYYARAFIKGSYGTYYGNEINFKTVVVNLPVVKTIDIEHITATMVIVKCELIDNGGSNETLTGSCLSKNSIPTVKDKINYVGSGSSSLITGVYSKVFSQLTPNTKYYIRACATNSTGTVYGDILGFTTRDFLIDNDGDTCSAIKIGSQTWMAEDLSTKKYRNGDLIKPATYTSDWWGTTPIYYGNLFNWYAVNDARQIAPNGWHVATNEEWSILINYLGGESVATEKIKGKNVEWIGKGWYNKGTNESGFTGYPTSLKSITGNLLNTGNAYWWTATPAGTSAYYWVCSNQISNTLYDKGYGLAVRCIKN